MEVDSSEGIELGSTETGWSHCKIPLFVSSVCAAFSADKVIIGLPSEVIVHRDQATPPAVQLSQATECLHLGSSPSDMCFSFNASVPLYPALVYNRAHCLYIIIMYRESLYCPMLERVSSCATFPKIDSEGEQDTSLVKNMYIPVFHMYCMIVSRHRLPLER